MNSTEGQMRTKSSKKKVAFIFFQSPSEAVLSRITDYLRINHFYNCGYFSKYRIPVTFKHLGELKNVPGFITENPPEELILVGYPANKTISQDLLLTLKFSRAIIKLIPVDFNLITGLVQVNSHKDLPHIRLYPERISQADRLFKSFAAIISALAGLFITAFIFPFVAILIKTTSKGPIFYKQTRLGKNARPFTLYKFRTMHRHSEKNGPQLSHSEDIRITKAGKILRYWHIDEFPQFWNILKGDMVLVGPRPERPFFANFLAKEILYYKIIYQEKPGLTSLGMIKFGYASTINEMTDRLYYDIVYLNNPSFLMDLKIIVNTLSYIILKAFLNSTGEKRENPKIQKSMSESHDPLVRWLSMKNSING